MIRLFPYFLAALILAAMLSGCAPVPDGSPVQVNAPQAVEQCKAQPELDWCKP